MNSTREVLEFLLFCSVGLVIAYIIYPFAVIKSFVTGKHESELETIGYGECVRGCFIANCGAFMILLPILAGRVIT